METAKLLGYYKSSTHKERGADEYQSHNEGDVTYHFIVDLNNQQFEFTAEEAYGSCGSGYCGASWGSIENRLSNVKINNLTAPKKDIFLNVFDGQIQITEKDQIDSYDPTITQVLTTDGEELVSSTGNGGCNYYPSGTVTFNEELFK